MNGAVDADTIIQQMEQSDSTQALRLEDLRSRQSEYVPIRVPPVSLWAWLKHELGLGGK